MCNVWSERGGFYDQLQWYVTFTTGGGVLMIWVWALSWCPQRLAWPLRCAGRRRGRRCKCPPTRRGRTRHGDRSDAAHPSCLHPGLIRTASSGLATKIHIPSGVGRLSKNKLGNHRRSQFYFFNLLVTSRQTIVLDLSDVTPDGVLFKMANKIIHT